MEIFTVKEWQNRHIYILKYIEKIDNLILKVNEAIVDGDWDKEWEDSDFILDKVLEYVENIKQIMPNWKQLKQIKIQIEEIQDYKNKIEELENKLKQK